VQGPLGDLDGEANDDEREAGPNQDGAFGRWNRVGEFDHVERPRRHEDEGDADQVHRRGDGSQDQVLQGGNRRLRAVAARDERVGRDARDLEEDEQVEDVAGQRDAEQAGDQQQVRGVERVPARAAAARVYARTPVATVVTSRVIRVENSSATSWIPYSMG